MEAPLKDEGLYSILLAAGSLGSAKATLELGCWPSLVALGGRRRKSCHFMVNNIRHVGGKILDGERRKGPERKRHVSADPGPPPWGSGTSVEE